MDLKQKVMNGLFWSAGGKFIGQLITWGITIIVIRLLEPGDYGLMSLTTVVVGFLAMLNELGLGAAIVQQKDVSEENLRALFGLLLLSSLLLYLFLFLMAPIISNFYGEPRLTNLIKVMALQFILMGFTVVPRSLLLREMAFKKLAWVELVSAVTGSVFTLFLVFKGYGVWALAWGTLVIRIVAMLGLNYVKPLFQKPILVFTGMGHFLSFGGYVTLSRILWYFYTTADILIVGKLLGKDILGFYSVGVYLANLPMEKVSGLINQVAFPAFSSISSDSDIAERHFLKAVRVLSCIAFPVLWGMAGIAPQIVDVFLGTKWNEASIPFLIVALIVPIRMVSNLINPAVLGLGAPKISFLNSLVAFIVMPIAFYIGAKWGILGVSLAWMFAFPVVFLWNLSQMIKVLKIKIIDVVLAMFRPFFVALIMFGALRLLSMYSIGDHHDILRMLFFIVCGAGIYGGGMWIINRGGVMELKELFQK